MSAPNIHYQSIADRVLCCPSAERQIGDSISRKLSSGVLESMEEADLFSSCFYDTLSHLVVSDSLQPHGL